MLHKKSRELTWKILAKLNVKYTSSGFSLIYQCILKSIENTYIQARLDSINNVKYELLDDLSVYFPDN